MSKVIKTDRGVMQMIQSELGEILDSKIGFMILDDLHVLVKINDLNVLVDTDKDEITLLPE